MIAGAFHSHIEDNYEGFTILELGFSADLQECITQTKVKLKELFTQLQLEVS